MMRADQKVDLGVLHFLGGCIVQMSEAPSVSCGHGSAASFLGIQTYVGTVQIVPCSLR